MVTKKIMRVSIQWCPLNFTDYSWFSGMRMKLPLCKNMGNFTLKVKVRETKE